jgi:hypothetical protein
VLDRVKDRAQALSGSISASDRGKLDEYLTSVREIEKRVEIMRKGQNAAQDSAQTKNASLAVMERPANGLPEDLREHAKLMCDITAIAFQTNKTNVASLMISRDMSSAYYPPRTTTIPTTTNASPASMWSSTPTFAPSSTA